MTGEGDLCEGGGGHWAYLLSSCYVGGSYLPVSACLRILVLL